jgi:hypothetical protein
MAMSKNIGDREYTKFVEDAEGNTSIRVVSGIQDADGDKLSVTRLGEAVFTSPEIISLLESMLTELKAIRLHMQIGTSADIRDKDL